MTGNPDKSAALTSEPVSDQWIAENLNWYRTATPTSQGGHIYRALLELKEHRESMKRIEEYGH